MKINRYFDRICQYLPNKRHINHTTRNGSTHWLLAGSRMRQIPY